MNTCTLLLLLLVFLLAARPPLSGQGSGPLPPDTLRARVYDSHVELRWPPSPTPAIQGYRLYRSTDGDGSFSPLATISRSDTLYIDWIRPLGYGRELQYRIATRVAGQESGPTSSDPVATREMTDEELLDMVQEYTFRYFWDFAHPVSGLIRERNTSGEVVTMGGTGFGVMALLVGAERGFITREQARDRILQMVLFLETADRFYGAFPHWMNGATGRVVPFSPRDNGGDIVETAFLFEGLLAARQYFDGDHPDEEVLRQKITQLFYEINWNWYRQQIQNVIYWHWSPQYDFAINLPVRGWNETMMVYLLALGSPTFGVPASLWDQGWAGGNYVNGNEYYGIQLPVGPFRGGPLFFTHYSFLGFDPRHKRDDYTNYFVQNRNQTLINRAYCIDNPEGHEGYGPESWGLTASDDPVVGYLAHEPVPERDNGTITPTAALSSMPYTPDESLAALRHFYRELGDRLWGPMGFYDAFNLDLDWFASSYLAIDQGPIIGMIENYRSELLWNLFMSNEEIQTAMDKIGFVPDSTTTAVFRHRPDDRLEARVFPNPLRDAAQIRVRLAETSRLSVDLLDAAGHRLRIVLDDRQLPAGESALDLQPRGLPPGLYYLRLRTGRGVAYCKLIINF